MAIPSLGRFNPAQTDLNLNNPFGVGTKQGPDAAPVQTVGEQVSQSLFSRPAPLLMDAAAFPDLQAMLVVLDKYRRKLALLVGDRDDDYALALAQDTIAAIDDRGIIFLGAHFLLAHKHRLEVVVGAIAHEIGHRPKRMKQLAQNDTRKLTEHEKNALLLHEEIRADSFAGRGLAELNMSCEPLITFLYDVSVHPHPQYLPVKQRAEVIREGFAKRQYRADSRRKLFPEFDRHTAAKMHLGEY